MVFSRPSRRGPARVRTQIEPNHLGPAIHLTSESPVDGYRTREQGKGVNGNKHLRRDRYPGDSGHSPRIDPGASQKACAA